MNSPLEKSPNRTLLIMVVLAGLTFIGSSSVKNQSAEKPKYKNLKVLSPEIDDENMEWVMETFNSHLGVNCLFCHPAKQNGTEFRFDYATDQLQNKRIARDMLTMTMKINKKFFNTRLTGMMETRGIVWCKTCHGGKPVPLVPSKK